MRRRAKQKILLILAVGCILCLAKAVPVRAANIAAPARAEFPGVYTNQSSWADLKVYDVSGKEIEKKYFSVSGDPLLAPGLYDVTIRFYYDYSSFSPLKSTIAIYPAAPGIKTVYAETKYLIITTQDGPICFDKITAKLRHEGKQVKAVTGKNCYSLESDLTGLKPDTEYSLEIEYFVNGVKAGPGELLGHE